MRFPRIIGLAAFSLLCLTRASAVTITETVTHFLHDSWTFGPSNGGNFSQHVIQDYFPQATGPLELVTYTSHVQLSVTMFLYNAGTTTLNDSPTFEGFSYFYFGAGGFPVGDTVVHGPVLSLAPNQGKTFSTELIQDETRSYTGMERDAFAQLGVITANFVEFYGMGYLGAQVSANLTVSVTSTLTYNYAAVPEGGSALAMLAFGLGGLAVIHRRKVIS